jgi:hypothetical protein
MKTQGEVWNSQDDENFKSKKKPSKVLPACLTQSSILKMEAVCSSKTSENFYQTTRRNIPEDGTLNVKAMVS